MAKKKTHGGAREGSGPKKGVEKEVFTVRLPKGEVKKSGGRAFAMKLLHDAWDEHMGIPLRYKSK